MQYMFALINPSTYVEGALAQSVECATPGEEAVGSIPAVAARSLLVGYNVTV